MSSSTRAGRVRGFVGWAGSLVAGEGLLSLLAVLYLALFVVDRGLPSRTLEYLSLDTLSVIVALMMVSRGLELSGVFNRLAVALVESAGYSRLRVHVFMIALSALASAVIMNDAALFIFIPFALSLSSYLGGADFLLAAVTIAANVGSSLTPIGNPQNIIIWHSYNLGFMEFTRAMAPFSALSLLLLVAYSAIHHRRSRASPVGGRGMLPRVRLDKPLFTASLLLLVADIILAQLGLQAYGLALTLAVYLVVNRMVVYGLDYRLILIFMLMFIDFREVSHLLRCWSQSPLAGGSVEIIVLSAVLSQLISNVPATITLIDHIPRSQWRYLAIGVNLGGVGLVIGSMANIITLRLGRLDQATFHKYTLPYFAILLAATIILLA
ncbi:MAG: anion permease [Desulfurococcales archaeon]|nr:anion permease [Desulfurococcales archaeon]